MAASTTYSEPHTPNRSAAAGILWTCNGIRPIPVLRTLAGELESEAAGYRVGRHPSPARRRALRAAARLAHQLARLLEILDTERDD